jgi:hypothetical protein
LCGRGDPRLGVRLAMVMQMSFAHCAAARFPIR